MGEEEGGVVDGKGTGLLYLVAIGLVSIEAKQDTGMINLG